jgi:hypothetical protein
MTREIVDASPCADLDTDGLVDIYETGNGVFVNASETGTSPTVADTDGDRVLDGAEVAAGSNPNDPQSLPEMIPTLSDAGPAPRDRALALGAPSVAKTRAGTDVSNISEEPAS